MKSRNLAVLACPILTTSLPQAREGGVRHVNEGIEGKLDKKGCLTLPAIRTKM